MLNNMTFLIPIFIENTEFIQIHYVDGHGDTNSAGLWLRKSSHWKSPQMFSEFLAEYQDQ